MSQNTSKGITYPENNDHARLWEWFQTLATTADGVIPGSVDVQVFTASGTWTRPSGAIWVVVEVQGAGGGSGGIPSTGSGTASSSPGASGGEYARGVYTAAAAGSSQAVTVGTGGTGGSVGANAGNNGGTSSFGALITAVGGNGSQAGATASASSSVSLAGADGGSGGTGGSFRLQGGDGGCSQCMSGWPVKINTGGGSYFAGVQRSSGISVGGTGGISGNSYGGGASGASAGPGVSAQSGAAGADGIVIVTTIKA